MMAFELPPLPYPNDALEPSIDAMTMEIHHDRHHKAYVDKLNAAVDGTDAANLPIEDIIKNISKYPAAVRNNGGGHYNHSLFWKMMKNGGGGNPAGDLGDAINNAFGSFDDFKKKFEEAGANRFGSGWAWLIVKDDGSLVVTSTPNQDNPMMDIADEKGTPILGCDVWEHAYYLKYQNKRPDYLAAFWNVVNWDEVANLYSSAKA
ncbi:MAG: superoxide dismutase [Ignavibacteriales bacterium]|nr:superoxide dismutase [Ignavibacteriales bacterium]